MEEELKREIRAYGHSKCSRAIIDVAIQRMLSRWKGPEVKGSEPCEELLITCQLYGYTITVFAKWNSIKETWNFPINIIPIGKVQKFYENLVNDEVDVIMYETGEAIYFCSLEKVAYEQYPLKDICEENGFAIEVEIRHPEEEGLICYRLKPKDE